jgi:dipeptidyl aminopeptidase/acylaminoacyl peptidase
LTRVQGVSDARLAPDGKSIVFVHKQAGPRNEYVTNLWRVDTAGGAATQFTSGGRDAQPRWSPDGTRIAFVGRREKTRPQVYIIPAAGGEAVALTRLPEGSIGRIRWSPDGATIGMSFREQDPEWTEDAKKEREAKGLSDPPRVLDHWWYRLDGDGYFNAQRYHLHLVDATTGEHRRVYADTLGAFSFDFAPDGTQMVIATNRDRRAGLREWNDELLRLDLRSGRIAPIPGLPQGPKDAVAWSPDGRLIAYGGRVGPDSVYSTENLELWVCDAQRGKARSLTDNEDYCLTAAILSDTAEADFAPVFCWSADSRRVYVQVGWQGEMHLASVAAAGGGLTFHTAGPAVHRLGNISSDGRFMSMTVGSATAPDEVAIAPLHSQTVTPRLLTRLNQPLLEELHLSEPKTQWIKSADGTRVQVWSMLPPGLKAGRRVPAVLEIHGGPHAQYGVAFFHEFQLLAAAGYAVFYSNPRGSKGYGRDHCAAIRGSWGGADWTDMQAVIAFMRSHKSVKAGRMGVMGGSYGGYMTNWIIGHTTEFAGAITDRCVSNLVSMHGSSDYLEPPDIYWEGNAWDRPEALWRSSPLRHLGRASTPTLIIHSEGDLRCNIEQAEQVFAALSLRGVPARFVRYPRSTSHGMSRSGPPDMRLHRLEQIVSWWRKHLDGRGAARGA